MCIFCDCISTSLFYEQIFKQNASLHICCLFTGDVSPISMSPISQSQFIPLGEILCLAISAMNSARKQVTQEALMEHLTTCFPGNWTLINHWSDGQWAHVCKRAFKESPIPTQKDAIFLASLKKEFQCLVVCFSSLFWMGIVITPEILPKSKRRL